MWQSLKILNVFNTWTQIFWKTKIFFKKTGGWKRIITISEENIKSNKTLTTKLTYENERSFAGNYFIFLKILFQSKNLLK